MGFEGATMRLHAKLVPKNIDGLLEFMNIRGMGVEGFDCTKPHVVLLVRIYIGCINCSWDFVSPTILRVRRSVTFTLRKVRRIYYTPGDCNLSGTMDEYGFILI